MTSNARVAGMRPRRAIALPSERGPHAAGRIIGSVALLASMAMAAPRAWSIPALSVAQANAVIARTSHGAAHVVEVFPGPDGLVGAIVVGRSASRGIVWLTPHGEAVISGGVLRDRDGRDLTRVAMRSRGMLLSPAAVWAQAGDRVHRGILLGRSGPLMTVLFDPDCADCRELYHALSPAVTSGRVRVRYLLVGMLKPGSAARAARAARAASILATARPAEALAINEATYAAGRAEGGFPIAATPGAVFIRAVAANNALLARAGATGTPATYYCTRASRKVMVMFGVPRDIPAFLAQADPSGIACGERW